MFSSVDLFFEDNFLSHERSTSMYRLRRGIRDSSNPLELPNQKFISYFRLNKDAFKYVLDLISRRLISKRTSTIPPIIKLACALRFFADGSYQKSVSNDFELGLAQPTVSVILSEILEIFEKDICATWIKTDMTEAEKQEARNFFFSKAGLPRIIGCVDGTHIGIVSPPQLRHQYLNRKGYYSLNAMIACDHNMVIRYVDGRYPGSTHDSFVWNCSQLKAILARWYANGERMCMYLGDSGYPLLPYLLTPYRNTSAGSSEALFNKKHAKARNIVERTIGLLKIRFRCLLNQRILHYPPEKATKILNTCCALHNICRSYNVLDPEEIDHVEFTITSETSIDGINSNSTEGERIRNNILASL